MLEVLQFYVSGFWTWIGLTIGLAVVAGGISNFVRVTINRVTR